jgi:hypothetical protein
MLDARSMIGTHDVLFVTLDTLRYDVAVACLRAGRTPNLAAVLPGRVWEERHSPGNFTFVLQSDRFVQQTVLAEDRVATWCVVRTSSTKNRRPPG